MYLSPFPFQLTPSEQNLATLGAVMAFLPYDELAKVAKLFKFGDDGARAVSQLDEVNGLNRGGRNTALSGRPAEQAVSQSTGIPLNQGPGRQIVPGTGPGGFRVPDLKVFGPDASFAQRGSIIEVKNASRISGTKQIRDLAEQANAAGGHLEIFTNAPAPKSGELARRIIRGEVILRPLP